MGVPRGTPYFFCYVRQRISEHVPRHYLDACPASSGPWSKSCEWVIGRVSVGRCSTERQVRTDTDFGLRRGT